MKLIQTLFVAANSLLILSCQSVSNDQSISNELKFDKSRWIKFDDSDGGEYPYRERMLSDLVKNHQLKSLTYRQLVDSLGKPENSTEKDDTVRYEIIVGFESDIDPTYGKNLNLALGPDSVVTSYKISEWKHN